MREAWEPPALSTGENRRWYAKALYPGPDMPLWVVALLAVSLVAVTVSQLLSSWQAREYAPLAFWAIAGSAGAARYVLVFVRLLRTR